MQHIAMIPTLAFLSMPGWTEFIVIGFLGLLFFGRRLPEIARSLGKSVVEFKKGIRDIKDDIETTSSTNDTRRLESPPRTSLPPTPPPLPHQTATTETHDSGRAAVESHE